MLNNDNIRGDGSQKQICTNFTNNSRINSSHMVVTGRKFDQCS